MMAKYGLGSQTEVSIDPAGQPVEMPRQVLVIGGKEIWF